MKLSSFITDFKATVLSATGIPLVQQKVGYLHQLNTGKEVFDHVLIIPPKLRKEQANNDSVKDYIMEWYIFRLDKGAGGGRMTETEMIIAWEALEQKNTALMDALIAQPTKFQILNGYESDFDSAEGGAILTTPVIWMKVNCIIRTDHCSGL